MNDTIILLFKSNSVFIHNLSKYIFYHRLADCPDGFTSLDEGCYHVILESLDFKRSTTRCHELNPGAHLAFIDSAKESNDLIAHIGSLTQGLESLRLSVFILNLKIQKKETIIINRLRYKYFLTGIMNTPSQELYIQSRFVHLCKCCTHSQGLYTQSRVVHTVNSCTSMQGLYTQSRVVHTIKGCTHSQKLYTHLRVVHPIKNWTSSQGLRIQSIVVHPVKSCTPS